MLIIKVLIKLLKTGYCIKIYIKEYRRSYSAAMKGFCINDFQKQWKLSRRPFDFERLFFVKDKSLRS
jgi:hypothetical protein